MQIPDSALIKRAVAAIVAVLAVIGGTVLVIDTDGPGPLPARTVTIPKTVPAPLAATAPQGDLQGPTSVLRDSTPSGVPKESLNAGKQVAEQVAAEEDLPPADQPIETGGAQLNPCKTSYASNRSSYGARKVRSYGTVLHYTVSANVRGWSDVYGIRSYLNRVRLSANDIMDFEGNCLHTVPYTNNAYTQGPFNQYYDSLEIVATGQETRAQWLAAPIFKRHILANYLTDRLKARGVPLRFVDPVACGPLTGYSDHFHLECGNNHYDVAPSCARGNVLANPTISAVPFGRDCSGFPFDVLARQLNDGQGSMTAVDKVTCRKLQWWRTHGRPHGKAETNAITRRQALASRHVTCTAKGPVAA